MAVDQMNPGGAMVMCLAIVDAVAVVSLVARSHDRTRPADRVDGVLGAIWTLSHWDLPRARAGPALFQILRC
ncbi:MAG: hypothetical protein JW895_09290 [Thermoleophilaceae bacterium]|nr:hypothetical protein [Thermoleophilaceae bacterium]